MARRARRVGRGAAEKLSWLSRGSAGGKMGAKGTQTSMLRSSSYSGNYARDEPSFAAVLISQTFHAIEHALVGSAIFRYIGAVPVQLKLGLSNARR